MCHHCGHKFEKFEPKYYFKVRFCDYSSGGDIELIVFKEAGEAIMGLMMPQVGSGQNFLPADKFQQIREQTASESDFLRQNQLLNMYQSLMYREVAVDITVSHPGNKLQFRCNGVKLMHAKVKTQSYKQSVWQAFNADLL